MPVAIGFASSAGFCGARKKNCVLALTCTGTPTPSSSSTVIMSVVALTLSTWPSGLTHTVLKVLLAQTRTATSVPFSW